MLSGICAELMAGIGHAEFRQVSTNRTKLLPFYNNATNIAAAAFDFAVCILPK